MMLPYARADVPPEARVDAAAREQRLERAQLDEALHRAAAQHEGVVPHLLQNEQTLKM
jgi:hypothetical protein